ncbi:MAG: hypothetical protein GEU95_07205 [Rhizobiales bacterium]|nr:hypothetical protein [Hyphomicrobiales bacterium]
MTQNRSRNALAPLLAALLCLVASACVSSTEPILSDARSILGDRGRLHIFSAPKDGARNVLRYNFQWRRDRYVAATGPRAAPVEFTAHPFEGRDLVVQWKSATKWSPKQKPRGLRPVTYFLLRKVAEGAFLMLPITEGDADDATRDRFCIKSPETTCRISTPEQLFAFARAAAEKEDPDAGVVVIEAPAKQP